MDAAENALVDRLWSRFQQLTIPPEVAYPNLPGMCERCGAETRRRPPVQDDGSRLSRLVIAPDTDDQGDDNFNPLCGPCARHGEQERAERQKLERRVREQIDSEPVRVRREVLLKLDRATHKALLITAQANLDRANEAAEALIEASDAFKQYRDAQQPVEQRTLHETVGAEISERERHVRREWGDAFDLYSEISAAWDLRLEREADERNREIAPPPRFCCVCYGILPPNVWAPVCSPRCREYLAQLKIEWGDRCEWCHRWFQSPNEELSWCSPHCLVASAEDLAEYVELRAAWPPVFYLVPPPLTVAERRKAYRGRVAVRWVANEGGVRPELSETGRLPEWARAMFPNHTVRPISAVPSGAFSPSREEGLTVAQRIVQLLESGGGEPTAKEIAERVNAHRPAIWAALRRLRKAGQVFVTEGAGTRGSARRYRLARVIDVTGKEAT
jgi:hypothetical protein